MNSPKRDADKTERIWLDLRDKQTWWRIMGLLAKSTRGFGTLKVSGRSLVPKPPTNIKAFMMPTERTLQPSDEHNAATSESPTPDHPPNSLKPPVETLKETKIVD